MRHPAPLPVLLRTVCLAGIAAWLAWQVLAVSLLTDSMWYARTLTLVVILLVVFFWARRRLRQSHAPGWRRSDAPVMAFFLLLLLFEGYALRQGAPAADRTVNIAPWSVESLRPDDRAHARALEAAWREQLWQQNDWTPVTWFLVSEDDPPRDDTVHAALQFEDQRLVLQLSEHHNGASEQLAEAFQDRQDPSGNANLVNRAIDAVNQRFRPESGLEPLAPNRQYDTLLEAQIDCAIKNRVVQDLALKTLRDGVFLEPQSAINHAALANCILLLVEQWPDADPPLRHEARASANRALVLQPELVAAQIAAATAAWRFDRNAARAEALWRQALETFPNQARVRLELADMLFATGRTEAAMLEVQRARINAPDHPRALYLLGLEALEQQQPGRAAQLLQAALDAAPESARFRQALDLAIKRTAEDADSP